MNIFCRLSWLRLVLLCFWGHSTKKKECRLQVSVESLRSQIDLQRGVADWQHYPCLSPAKSLFLKHSLVCKWNYPKAPPPPSTTCLGCLDRTQLKRDYNVLVFTQIHRQYCCKLNCIALFLWYSFNSFQIKCESKAYSAKLYLLQKNFCCITGERFYPKLLWNLVLFAWISLHFLPQL